MSIRSADIALSRAFNSARSGVAGAYERFGSLTGCGTRRTPPNAVSVEAPADSVVAVACAGLGMVEVGVDMVALYNAVKETIVLMSGAAVRDAGGHPAALDYRHSAPRNSDHCSPGRAPRGWTLCRRHACACVGLCADGARAATDRTARPAGSH